MSTPDPEKVAAKLRADAIAAALDAMSPEIRNDAQAQSLDWWETSCLRDLGLAILMERATIAAQQQEIARMREAAAEYDLLPHALVNATLERAATACEERAQGPDSYRERDCAAAIRALKTTEGA